MLHWVLHRRLYKGLYWRFLDGMMYWSKDGGGARLKTAISNRCRSGRHFTDGGLEWPMKKIIGKHFHFYTAYEAMYLDMSSICSRPRAISRNSVVYERQAALARLIRAVSEALTQPHP